MKEIKLMSGAGMAFSPKEQHEIYCDCLVIKKKFFFFGRGPLPITPPVYVELEHPATPSPFSKKPPKIGKEKKIKISYRCAFF